jgi:hypothetical protein
MANSTIQLSSGYHVGQFRVETIYLGSVGLGNT